MAIFPGQQLKEIDIGMTADVGTLQRLPHLIGQGVVRELAYTGRRVPAGEAMELRLVNRVFAGLAAQLRNSLGDLPVQRRKARVKFALSVKPSK